MGIIIFSSVYAIGTLLTWKMIVDSNIPNISHQLGSLDSEPAPQNLSPLWSFMWPVFWLKTIPIFCEIQREEKNDIKDEKKKRR